MRSIQKVVYLVFAVSLSSLLHAQQCLPSSTLIQNWANSTPPGTDGLTHTTYDFIDSSGILMTPDAATLASVTTAIG